MPEVIRILHVEDQPQDTELLIATLEAEGLQPECLRVDTPAAFAAALRSHDFDVILSDFSLPGFGGPQALEEARRVRPELPFVFLSGTIGEENAVDMLKRGATDYVLKERPRRLVSAIRRALREAESQRSRLLAEQALHRSEERFQLVARATNDVIWDWDLAAGEIWWNAAIESFGYPRAQVGRAPSWRESKIHPDDRVRVISELGAAIHGDSASWRSEYRMERADGQYADVIDRAFILRDAAGRAIRCVGALVDLTERKNTEQQLFRAQRLDSLGTLAGGIAHDLNNMLAPILTAVSLLKSRIPDQRHQRLLSAVETSAVRGAQMVKQILTFARGTGTTRILVQPRHVMREVEAMARETFPRTIDVTSDAPADLWTVSGDATLLYQVLLNLCVNARDAMPHGGSLHLKAANVTLDAAASSVHRAAIGDYVLLSVSDSGSGIAPEVLDRIFEAFFTTKDQGRGTGLGLSTSLAIVRGHGGFISVDSRLGEGTTFQVYLPGVRSDETEPEPDDQELPMGGGETILLVDDEAAIREMIKETLESQGYRVLTAADGAEAIEAFHRHRGSVAVVIIDRDMPVMDGLEATRALKAVDPSVRVILTSGLAPDEPLTDLRGITFLQKPCSAARLLTAIAAQLAA